MTDAQRSEDAKKAAEQAITAAAAKYKRDEARAKDSRAALAEHVLDALREKTATPTEATKWSGWTAAYVRKLARENGIEADEKYKARQQKPADA